MARAEQLRRRADNATEGPGLARAARRQEGPPFSVKAWTEETWQHLISLIWREGWPPHEVWPELLRLAAENGLLPLVAFLVRREEDKLPQEVRVRLREARYRALVLHAVSAAQVRQLGQMATALDTDAILLKGPVVARTYPHPAARTFGDLDLLASSEEAAHLLAGALKAQGYTPRADSRVLFHLSPMHPPTFGLRVEVHYRLDEYTRTLSVKDVWEQARPLPNVSGLWEMAPVDHSLYLIAHGVRRHSLEAGLRWLYDISCWTQGWDAGTWKALVERAQAWRMERTVRLAGALWAWVLGKPWGALPFAALLSPPPVEAETVARRAILRVSRAPLPSVWRDGTRRGIGGWLRYGRAILTRGGELALAEVPRRLVYLARQHGPALWRLLQGDSRSRSAWRDQRELYGWLYEGRGEGLG
jgi:hypothetical protein